MKIKLVLIAMLLFVACTDTTFYWYKERDVFAIRGIVNDSLALQSTYRMWSKTVKNPLRVLDDFQGGGNEGLHLINFRNKSPFIWSDTLDHSVHVLGQLTDSVVFGGDLDEEVSFWKIGQKPVTKKVRSWVGSCSPRIPKNTMYPHYQIRPWRGGKFLILGSSTSVSGDTCQYAVLDTSTGVIEQSRFSDNDSWMSGCDDISFFTGKTVCIKSRIEVNRYGVELIVDGFVEDSILWDSATWLINKDLMNWYGKQLVIYHPLQNNDESPNVRGGRLLYRLDTIAMRLYQIEPAVWLTDRPYGFADSTGKKVFYDKVDFNILSEGNP